MPVFIFMTFFKIIIQVKLSKVKNADLDFSVHIRHYPPKYCLSTSKAFFLSIHQMGRRKSPEPPNTNLLFWQQFLPRTKIIFFFTVIKTTVDVLVHVRHTMTRDTPARHTHVMMWGLGPFLHIRGGVGREL